MLKLGVIFGGMSTEHDVSIASGTSVIQNLDKGKYEVYPIYIDQSGKWYEYTKKVNEIKRLAVGDKLDEITPISNVIEYLKQIDIAFPVLHGLYGEDGGQRRADVGGLQGRQGICGAVQGRPGAGEGDSGRDEGERGDRTEEPGGVDSAEES